MFCVFAYLVLWAWAPIILWRGLCVRHVCVGMRVPSCVWTCVSTMGMSMCAFVSYLCGLCGCVPICVCPFFYVFVCPLFLSVSVCLICMVCCGCLSMVCVFVCPLFFFVCACMFVRLRVSVSLVRLCLYLYMGVSLCVYVGGGESCVEWGVAQRKLNSARTPIFAGVNRRTYIPVWIFYPGTRHVLLRHRTRLMD